MPQSQKSSLKSRKRLIVIVLLVLSLGGAAIVVRQQLKPSKERLLKRAERYLEAGDYASAKIVYMNAGRMDPSDPLVYAALGKIWATQGSPLRALPFLASTSPEDIDSRIMLASVQLALGGREMSENARREALEIFRQRPNDEEAIMLLANTTEPTLEGIAETEDLLATLQGSETVASHLANASLAILRNDEFGREMSVIKALAIGPDSVGANLAMGEIYELREEWDEAEQCYLKAANAAERRSPARLKIAKLKLERGAFDEARTLLEPITSEVPDLFPAWLLLAQVEFKDKKYDEALAALDNIFSIDPVFFEARILQAQALIEKGDIELAIKGLEEIPPPYSGHALRFYELGRAHVLNGALGKAAIILQELESIYPNYLVGRMLLAQVNLRAGNPEQVVPAMKEILEKHPGDGAAQLMLISAYQAMGQPNEAAAIVSQQIASNPRRYGPHFLLGTILLGQGELEGAR